VRAARRAGSRGPISARQVFAAAERGERWAAEVFADEALLVARAVCAVVTVVDPELIVLGGGICQANGFLEAVDANLRVIAPVMPDLKVSALGEDAIVDGCLAAGIDRAWQIVTAAVPVSAPPEILAAAGS
jgi:predicted NBD/HSP70 family sugar kinase